MERVLARNERAFTVWICTLIAREYALHARFRELSVFCLVRSKHNQIPLNRLILLFSQNNIIETDYFK